MRGEPRALHASAHHALHPSFTGEWDDDEEVHPSPSAAPASTSGRASQASSRVPSRTASAHQLAPEGGDGGECSAGRDSTIGARVRMGGSGGNLSARAMSRPSSMDFTDRRLSMDSSDQSDEYAEAAVSAAAAAAADADDAFGRDVRGRSVSSGFGPPRPSSASGVYPFGCSSSSSSSSRGNGSSGGSGGGGGGASTSRHVRSGSTGSACSNDLTGGSSGGVAGGMRSRTKSFSDASWHLADDRLLVSSGFVSASMDDRLLEVVAIKGVLQLGLAQVIAFEGLIMKGCLASDGL